MARHLKAIMGRMRDDTPPTFESLFRVHDVHRHPDPGELVLTMAMDKFTMEDPPLEQTLF
jgi:hypothetical protein